MNPQKNSAVLTSQMFLVTLICCLWIFAAAFPSIMLSTKQRDIKLFLLVSFINTLWVLCAAASRELMSSCVSPGWSLHWAILLLSSHAITVHAHKHGVHVNTVQIRQATTELYSNICGSITASHPTVTMISVCQSCSSCSTDSTDSKFIKVLTNYRMKVLQLSV